MRFGQDLSSSGAILRLRLRMTLFLLVSFCKNDTTISKIRIPKTLRSYKDPSLRFGISEKS